MSVERVDYREATAPNNPPPPNKKKTKRAIDLISAVRELLVVVGDVLGELPEGGREVQGVLVHHRRQLTVNLKYHPIRLEIQPTTHVLCV